MTRVHSLRVRGATLGLAVLTAGAGAVPRADSRDAPIDVATALDTYASGAFVKALEPVRRTAPDRLFEVGLQIINDGRLWVEREPADRSRRALVAAAFALEAQIVRGERGAWRMSEGEPLCTAACVLEWACGLLAARGAPDAAERTWLLATIAVAGGVHDWAFLQSPISPPGPRTQIRGHLVHARARFPDEPQFRLARAVTIASRLQVLPEMDAPRDGEVTGPAARMVELVRVIGPGAAVMADARLTQVDYARQQFLDLLSEPSVRAEALARLAYLEFRRGAYDLALKRAREAGDAATDADLRYAARYLAAQVSQAMGDLGGAEAFYASALEARPHSQSATLGLAALKYRRGDPAPAYALIESSFRERPADDDPWRLFLYGDFPRLPSLVAELRQQIGGVK